MIFLSAARRKSNGFYAEILRRENWPTHKDYAAFIVSSDMANLATLYKHPEWQKTATDKQKAAFRAAVPFILLYMPIHDRYMKLYIDKIKSDNEEMKKTAWAEYEKNKDTRPEIAQKWLELCEVCIKGENGYL